MSEDNGYKTSDNDAGSNPAGPTEEPESRESMFDLAQLKELGGYKAGDLLAVDPQLYPKFMTHISRQVKHDVTAKNMVFLTGVSAYTSEPINLFLIGESSIGKTYNVTQTLKYFPKKDIWLLGGLSPKALIHGHGKLVDEHGEEIKFENKPEKPRKSDYSGDRDYKEAFNEYKENLKTWRKRLEGSYYLIELSEKVLVFLEAPAFETFNILRPILSHDTPEISYRFTDKAASGKLQTKHVVIKGWPATIFCSTQERYVKDLATRGFTVTPDTTLEKYRDANILTGDKAAGPWEFGHDWDFMQLEGYVRFLKNHMNDMGIVVPYGPELAEEFPGRFPRSMRDFKHVVTLIKVYTLFHFAQRPVLVRKFESEEGAEVTKHYVMATRRDCDFIMGLWKEVRESTETSAPGHILKFFHQVVEKVAEEYPEFLLTDLVEGWNSRFEQRKSRDTIRKWVTFLCDIGWMTKTPSPKDKRVNLLSVIIAETGELPAFLKPDNFGLDSLKAWLNRRRSIMERGTLFVTDNFVNMRETPIETIYKKYFYTEGALRSNIDLGNSTASLGERSSELAGIQNAAISPVSGNFESASPQRKPAGEGEPAFKAENIKSLVRLDQPDQGECAKCSRKTTLEFSVTLHNGDYGFLCGKCGLQLQEQVGKAE